MAFECGPTLTAAGAAMLGASASQPVAAGRAGALLWAIAFTLRHRRDDPWIRLVARVSETDEAKGSREDERSAYVRMMDAVDGRD